MFITDFSLFSLLVWVLYVQENFSSGYEGEFCESVDVESSNITNTGYNYDFEYRKYLIQRSTRSTGLKTFIYLTETEQCLPPNIAKSNQIDDQRTCNYDVIVLSFRTKCAEDTRLNVTHLFHTNTGWASGRNEIFFAALDRILGYNYYFFSNDGTVLRFVRYTSARLSCLLPLQLVIVSIVHIKDPE